MCVDFLANLIDMVPFLFENYWAYVAKCVSTVYNSDVLDKTELLSGSIDPDIWFLHFQDSE